MVLGCEVGGRWSEEARSFVSQLAEAKSHRGFPQLRQLVSTLGSAVGALYWPAARLRLSPCPSWNVEVGLGWMGTHCHNRPRRVRTGVSGLVSCLRVGLA